MSAIADALFYAELTRRVAALCAQWMAAGFCHAVLNTDNMVITGESFDYGPYAFIPSFDPKFTAAYFDYFGRYSYANQPVICRWNLQALQVPLKMVISAADLEAGLQPYDEQYGQCYRSLMLQKLGFPSDWDEPVARELLRSTLEFLNQSQVGYHEFFAQLATAFAPTWWDDASQIFPDIQLLNDDLRQLFEEWRSEYQRALKLFPVAAYSEMKSRLQQHNPQKVIVRSVIEAVWEPIVQADNWAPMDELLRQIRESVSEPISTQ